MRTKCLKLNLDASLSCEVDMLLVLSSETGMDVPRVICQFESYAALAVQVG